VAKTTEELMDIEVDLDEYDVLDDIQPEDFVFVINSEGQLKGISFPETLGDDDEVNPNIEDIIKFLVKLSAENIRPADATLH